MEQAASNEHSLDPKALKSRLPDEPGVYLFKDRSGQVLYVGKAKSLKKRVLAYLKPARDLPQKTAIMMSRAQALDFILTATENEALILESNLVKRLMPRYNIVLRDDKQYPCLRLDLADEFPRLSIVRKMKRDGALYFGPYSSANAVRSTLKLINRIFQLRKCKVAGMPKRSRPCLNFQLERCLGTCSRSVAPAAYGEIVVQVRLFLEGRNRELIDQLKKKMRSASVGLDFERAARIRDQIRAVEKTVERQIIVSPKMEDQDAIGLAQGNGIARLVILFVRKGRLQGSRDYPLQSKGGSGSDVVEAFLKQYYPRESFIPQNILISEPIDELDPISHWLAEMSGKKVTIHHPLRGEKRRLVEMAVANAENLLSRAAESREEDLLDLARSILKLKKRPRTIEGLDISNLQGDMAVGTLVSFFEGGPHKAGYRNYRIKGVEGIDDYGMMAELVTRRLSKDELPDLFLVDGGKGHLMAVKRVTDRLRGRAGPDLVAIAKGDNGDQGDKVYIPGRKNPLVLRSDHPVLHLLMRIRDEAHRRAVTYHRKLRGKGIRASELDRIPGVGARRKRTLLKHFGDIQALSTAGLDDLLAVPGISRGLAERIMESLRAGTPEG
jgi:excinuclease ABC subunit C